MTEEEETHRCYGCQYDEDDAYIPECTGCRRRGNIEFNTPEEKAIFLGLKDKHTGVEVVTYGSTKILKRGTLM